MPKGKLEVFKVRLFLERKQRQELDSFLSFCNDISDFVFSIQKSAVLEGFPKKPEELTKLVIDSYEISEETASDCTHEAIEFIQNWLGSNARPRKNHRSYAISPSSVKFSLTEKVVRVPHIGLCKFKPNAKCMSTVNGADGVLLTKQPASMLLGYLNNEPNLVIET